MGTRSKDNHSKGSFGKKRFTRADYHTMEPHEEIIPPNPKTGAPAKTITLEKPVKHKNVIAVLRPNRGRDRNKHRKVSVRGRRALTFKDVLTHNLEVKKREDARTKPSLIQKMKNVFQRKAK